MRNLSILVLALVACGPPSANPAPEPEQASEMIRVPVGTTMATAAQINTIKPTAIHVAKPLNQVWLQMSTVYDSLGVPLNTIDPTTHTIGNGDLEARRRIGGAALRDYLNCGNTQGGSNTDTYEVRMSVLSKLAADPSGGTTITTTVQAMGRPISTAGEYLRCSSTGSLELRIGEAAKARSGG
ncbi:MAG TPA: hypothetical protein VGM50_02580 [Gemmatimonadaceae bacterium]